jgi:hypothetical protein
MITKNQITHSTAIFLSNLAETSPDALRAAEELIGATTQKMYGERFSLTEAINFLKAIKYISSVDEFSSEEKIGLLHTMEIFKVPADIIAHVTQFEVEGVSMDNFVALVQPGQLKAKCLIDGVIFVAIQDGFSYREREATQELAQTLGLRREIVDAYEARARLNLAIYATGNEDLYVKSLAADAAQWALS